MTSPALHSNHPALASAIKTSLPISTLVSVSALPCPIQSFLPTVIFIPSSLRRPRTSFNSRAASNAVGPRFPPRFAPRTTPHTAPGLEDGRARSTSPVAGGLFIIRPWKISTALPSAREAVTRQSAARSILLVTEKYIAALWEIEILLGYICALPACSLCPAV